MKCPIRRKGDNDKPSTSKKRNLILGSATAEFAANAAELSSKSLLANVLDINDDWINPSNSGTKKFQQPPPPQMTASTIPSFLQSNGNVVMPKRAGLTTGLERSAAYLRRENSNLSQSGTGTTDSGGGLGGSSVNDSSSSFYMSKNEMMRKCMQSILKELRAITEKLREDEDDEEKGLEWKFAAMVIDRLCMIVFAVATLLSAILILFTSKNIFKPSDPSPTF